MLDHQSYNEMWILEKGVVWGENQRFCSEPCIQLELTARHPRGRVAGIWQLLVNLPSSQWNSNLLRARTQSSSSCFAVQAVREVAASDLKFLALCTSLVMMNSCCLSHFPHSPGKTHNNSCRLSSLKDYCEHQWDICKAYRALGGRKLFYKLWSIRVLTGWDVLARNILWLSHQKKNVKR